MILAAIITVSGKAWVKDTEGHVRAAREGDPLTAGEMLITAEGASVSMAFVDGREPVTIAESTQVALAAEIGEGDLTTDFTLESADVATIIDLLERASGDLLDALEEPAAGQAGAGRSSEDHYFVRLLRIAEDVDLLSYEFNQAPQDDIVARDSEVFNEGEAEAEAEGEEDEDEDEDEDEPDQPIFLTGLDGPDPGDTPDIPGNPSTPPEVPSDSDRPEDPNDDIDLDVGDSLRVVDEAGLSDGSDAASNRETTSGTFAIGTRGGSLRSLVISGTDVTAGGTVNGAYGTLTVTESGGEYSWSYTLRDSTTDHSTVDSTAADDVRDTFSLEVTDSDNRKATGELSIDVKDDVPTARPDTASITEDTATALTGNVLTNDTQSADGMRSVVFNDPSAAQYGSFTDNGDGTWAYTLDNSLAAVQTLDDSESLTESLTYTLTDADGDTSEETLTITITGSNDTATITPPPASDPSAAEGNAASTVHETGLGDDSDSSESTTGGELKVSATDGIDSVTIGGKTFTVAELNELNTTSSSIDTGEGTLVLTGYSGSDTSGSIAYTYTLNEAQRHPDGGGMNSVQDDIVVKVEGRGDSSADRTLSITIVDDVPTAIDFSAGTLKEDDSDTLVSGNVLSDNGVDGAHSTYGADGTAATDSLIWGDATLAGGPSGGSKKLSDYGELTQEDGGRWSFELDSTRDATQALKAGDSITVTLPYTLTDGDKDSDSGKVTFAITGSNDTATITPPPASDPSAAEGNAASTVHETGLGDDSDRSESTTGGELKVSATDGIDSVTIGGKTFTVAELNELNTTSSSIDTGEGTLVLTGYTENSEGTNGTLAYTYTLNEAQTHPDGGGMNHVQDDIAVKVEARGDSSADGTLSITIVDDVPTAIDFSAGTLKEDGSDTLVSGNVLSDNGVDGAHSTYGADGTAATDSLVWGDATLAGGPSGGSRKLSDYGELTQEDGGRWSFELDSSKTATQALKAGDSITVTLPYTLTDGDKDSDSGKVTFTITGSNDTATITPPPASDPSAAEGNAASTVHETGLDDDSDSSESTTGGELKVSATDGIDSVTIDGKTFTVAELNGLSTTSSSIDTGEGTLVLTGYSGSDTSGSIAYTYTLNEAQRHPDGGGMNSVQDDIAVKVEARGDSSADGTLSITIVDDVPTAIDFSAGTLKEDSSDTLVSGNVLSDNGVDGAHSTYGADGTAVTDSLVWGDATLAGGPSGGSKKLSDYGELTQEDGGRWLFELDNTRDATQALKAGDSITVTLPYTLTDGDKDSDNGQVTFDINGTNDAPVIKSHDKTVNEDNQASGNVLSGARDTDGDSLAVTSFSIAGDATGHAAGDTVTITVDGKQIGTMIVNSNGDYTFTPEKNWNGTVPEITYVVSDGEANSSETLNIDVLPVNDQPDAENGSAGLNDSNNIYTFQTSDFNFSDPVEGDALQAVTISTLPEVGALYLNGAEVTVGQSIGVGDIENGKLIYSADNDSTDASFMFRVQDSGGTTNGGDDTSDIYTFDLNIGRFESGANDGDTITGGGGDDMLLGDAGGSIKNIEPAQKYNIAIILDQSKSMNNASGTPGKSRLELAKDALKKLASQLADHDAQVNVALVSFSGTAMRTEYIDLTNDNKDGFIKKIDKLSSNYDTHYEAGFAQAVEWFNTQNSAGSGYTKTDGYESLSFFLTDGKPTAYYKYDGKSQLNNTPSEEEIRGSYDGFDKLAALSEVHTIGVGNDIHEDVLKYFDNTGNVVDAGTHMLGNFDDGSTGWNNLSEWKSAVTVNTTGYNARLSRVQSESGQFTMIAKRGHTLTAYSPEMVVNAEDDARFHFRFHLDSSTPFYFGYSVGDQFEWNLQKKNSEGAWVNIETHKADYIHDNGILRLPESYSAVDDINYLTPDQLTNPIGEDGIYRLSFKLKNYSGSSFTDVKMWFDDFQLRKAGTVDVVNTAEDLETALDSGSSTVNQVPVGNDQVHGGEGNDILFADVINTDNLPWGVNGNPERPDDLPDGSGIKALKAFLTDSHGNEPTSGEMYDYIKANHEMFNITDDNRGGNDTVKGGAGDDILYGQGGMDRLYGGQGNDQLLGGHGADTFTWQLDDAGTPGNPSADVIADFSAADKLSLGDLLKNYDAQSDIDQAALDGYIHASQEGSSTTLYIKSDGGLSSDHWNADQTITLENVSMGGRSSHDFLSQLINHGQLDVD